MRMLIPCHEYPPVGGGAGAACAALAEEYVRQGHEVTVLTMGLEDLADREQIEGVDVVRVACGRKRKEMSSALEGLRWARRATTIAAWLQAMRPFAAVHAHFIMPAGIVGERLQSRWGLPLVITAHGSDVPGYNRERLKLAHLLARPWWRSIGQKADTIVCPSQSIRDLLRKCDDRFRTTVIPYGFDVGRFQPLEKEKRILLCSRLVERKGFQYFLAAIRDLELGGWEVDVVGDGPMRGRLAKLAQQCRTPVRMHGWIDNRDPRLVELYGRASLFVFPSEWENCPVALQEAMSAGCAIITTNVSGNPEVVGDAGVLVEPRNETALRKAVRQLTHDRARCSVLGIAARQRVVERFHLPRIAGDYVNLLTPPITEPPPAKRALETHPHNHVLVTNR